MAGLRGAQHAPGAPALGLARHSVIVQGSGRGCNVRLDDCQGYGIPIIERRRLGSGQGDLTIDKGCGSMEVSRMLEVL